MKHQCANCQRTFNDDQIIPLVQIKDLGQRLDPGSVVPSGECPACGSLVYPVTEGSTVEPPILVVKIREGVVDEATLFDDPKDAEEKFTVDALDLGAKKDDMESHLDDGYYQIMNASVCLVHPSYPERT